VVVKSISVGDVFTSITGNCWTITGIRCKWDELENRWETWVEFDLLVANTGDSHAVMEKARYMIQSLKTNAFCSQVHALLP
jgi:hypothetical protein